MVGARDDEPITEADRMILDALWSGVVNDWESDERHTKFLDHAHHCGALVEAATRYGLLRDDVDRGPVARKRLSAIVLLTTNELFAQQSPRATKRTPTWVVALSVIVCAILLGVASYAALAQDRAGLP